MHCAECCNAAEKCATPDADFAGLSYLGFPTSSENGYHPRQFRVHLGNPG